MDNLSAKGFEVVLDCEQYWWFKLMGAQILYITFCLHPQTARLEPLQLLQNSSRIKQLEGTLLCVSLRVFHTLCLGYIVSSTSPSCAEAA